MQVFAYPITEPSRPIFRVLVEGPACGDRARLIRVLDHVFSSDAEWDGARPQVSVLMLATDDETAAFAGRPLEDFPIAREPEPNPHPNGG